MKTKLILTILTTCVLTACKKDYTCECANPGGVYATYKIYDTKANASAKCDSYCSSCNFLNESHCDLK